jgi:hypothetical protein
VDKGFLERMKFAVGLQAFDSSDGFTNGSANRSDAGTDRPPVDEHGAGTALTFTATLLRAGYVEAVAKHEQEAAFRIGIDPMLLPVHVKFHN